MRCGETVQCTMERDFTMVRHYTAQCGETLFIVLRCGETLNSALW